MMEEAPKKKKIRQHEQCENDDEDFKRKKKKIKIDSITKSMEEENDEKVTKINSNDMDEEDNVSMKNQNTCRVSYLSPVASPLLNSKNLKKSLKLIQQASQCERLLRSQRKAHNQNIERNSSKSVDSNSNLVVGKRRNIKYLLRGVDEVSKALRKKKKGMVFLATDIYPIEICSHIPILCEDQNICYSYICTKKILGTSFRSKRPASCIMIVDPSTIDQQHLNECINDIKNDVDKNPENDQDFTVIYKNMAMLYKKVEKLIKKTHPFL